MRVGALEVVEHGQERKKAKRLSLSLLPLSLSPFSVYLSCSIPT
jgi:hypothetical protein